MQQQQSFYPAALASRIPAVFGSSFPCFPLANFGFRLHFPCFPPSNSAEKQTGACFYAPALFLFFSYSWRLGG
jgi:hypothetical protein